MTYKDVSDIIAAIGLPYAYYEFSDKTEQEPPFICFYYPKDNDFMADNQNYVGIRRLYIELYTSEKDFAKEALVEAALTGAGFSYHKTETRIDSERMWQILYETEVIINE